MSERQTGWYHVKTGVGWECARWELGRWYIAGTGHAYADASFEEIGDRIPTPDEKGDTVTMPRSLYELLYARNRDDIDRAWTHGQLSAKP